MLHRTPFAPLGDLLARPLPREAQAWENLADLLDQGLPPDQALASALGEERKNLPPGEPVPAALARLGWIDAGQEAFLEALERVGRLPRGLRALARFRRESHQALAALLGRAAYPLLALHLALLPLQIPLLLARGFPAALSSFLLCWAFLDLGLLAGILAVRRALDRGSLEKWPLLGSWFRRREQAKALLLLAELHGGGLLWDQALELAARALRAPSLRKRLREGASLLGEGVPPRQVLVRALALPEPCPGTLAAGEEGGRLQESLETCRKILQEEAGRKGRLLARAAGAGLYVLAAVFTLVVLLRALLAYSSMFRL